MISQPIIDYMQDNDPLKPNMELLDKMTPKQNLDVIRINADNAGLDVNKILIGVINSMAAEQSKE